MSVMFKLRTSVLLAVVCVFPSLALAQTYTPPFPREGAKKLQESDCFVIWDVTWEKGQSTGMRQLPLDQVAVFMTEGAVKVNRPDGTWSIEQESVGSVRFESKGTVIAEEGVSDKPAHATIFQIKDFAPPKWPVTEGIPGQFPREGAVKLFETDRFIVWDYTWKTGMRTPLHLHYNPTAAVYLAGGKTRSITGQKTRINVWKPGQIVNITAPLPAPHREEQLEGEARAIGVALK
jgi:quercetin dioxygenase-like cupin family protein